MVLKGTSVLRSWQEVSTLACLRGETHDITACAICETEARSFVAGAAAAVEEISTGRTSQVLAGMKRRLQIFPAHS